MAELSANKNSLSLIRLLAAVQVLFFHLVNHLELPVNSYVSRFIFYFRGVPIFFVLSGFLIWFSIERSHTYKHFCLKRFWRIYPELWGAVIVETISILLMYRKWNIMHMIMFVICQGTILQFWTPASLRDYGCGTPNGTLWTVCVIVQFYIISWLVYKLFHKKQLVHWVVLISGTVFISVIGQWVVENIGNEILVKLYGQTLFKYCWLFAVGCFIAEYKDKIIPSLSKFWYMFLVAGIIPYLTGFDVYAGYYVFWSIFMTCGMLGFAYAFPGLVIKLDISYGLFLYHMVVVNILIEIGMVGNWAYGIIAVAISVLCAWCSCITIGKWSVRKKGMLQKEITSV